MKSRLTYTFRAIHFYAYINNRERSFMTIHIWNQYFIRTLSNQLPHPLPPPLCCPSHRQGLLTPSFVSEEGRATFLLWMAQQSVSSIAFRRSPPPGEYDSSTSITLLGDNMKLKVDPIFWLMATALIGAAVCWLPCLLKGMCHAILDLIFFFIC